MAKKNDDRIEESIADQEPSGEPGDTRNKPAKSERQSAALVCPIHGVRCKAGSSSAVFTRYYCPHEDCSFSVKQQRPKAARYQPEEDFSAR